MNKKTIIYCYPDISTFIKKDLEIIETIYKLKTHEFNKGNKLFTPFRFISQFLFLTKNSFTSKAIICMFVGYHSFLPSLFGKIFNKPVIYILGGTECIYFPEYNIGGYRNKLFTLFMKLSYRLGTFLAPVHESLIECNYKYDKSGFPKQGVKFFLPWVNLPFKPIYNSYDSDKFYNTQVGRIENTFITVAVKIDGPEFYRKGIDLIIAAAKNFPDFKFTIIGKGDLSFINIPENVTIIPYVPNNELKNYYSQHEFYFQLSIAEGFPNAICEAMLCECIPIGSDVFGIPLIIGETGFILEKRENQSLFDLIENAVKADKLKLSGLARNRIKENFPMSRRKTELLELINSLH